MLLFTFIGHFLGTDRARRRVRSRRRRRAGSPRTTLAPVCPGDAPRRARDGTWTRVTLRTRRLGSSARS